MIQFNDATRQFWRGILGARVGQQEINDDKKLRDLLELDGISGEILWPGSMDVPSYLASDSYTTGDASTRLVTESTGSSLFYKKSSSYINVLDYGAKADGSTDDTTAWQNAVNAALVGGKIDGNGLTYLVGSISFKSNITVVNATFLTKPSSVDFVSPVTIGAYNDITLRENITFKNIHVNGNRTNHTNIGTAEGGGRHGFRIIGAVKNLLFEDCSADMCASYGMCLYRGIGMGSIQSYTTGIKSHIRLVRCQFTNNRAHGLAGDTLTDFKATDCDFSGNGIDVKGGTVEGDKGELSFGAYYGNGVDFEEYGIKDYCADISFINCTAYGNAKQGWFFYAGQTLANDPNYVTRKKFNFIDCAGDAGVSPASDGYTILMTPKAGNETTGTYYDDVQVLNSRISAAKFTACGNVRHSGGTASGFNSSLGSVNYVTSLKVNNVSSTYKTYSSSNSSVTYSEATERPLVIRSNDMVATTAAAPVSGGINHHATWKFNNGSADVGMAAQVAIPLDWSNVKITILWANDGLTSGDVKWKAGLSSEAPGTNLSVASTSFIVATAGAQNTVVSSVVAPSVAVTPGSIANLEVLREPQAASDTLNEYAHLLVILITRA